MENINSILIVISLFLLGIISPGPNFLALTHQSLNKGFRIGVATGLGMTLGDVLYAAIGLFGITSLINAMGSLFGLIKLVGGIYLVFLGFKMIKNQNSKFETAEPTENSNYKQAFRYGLLTDLANPKTILFFASIFATSVKPDMPYWVLFLMVVGIGVTSISWRIVLSYFFSLEFFRKKYQSFRKWIEFVFGIFLILFGLKLASEPIQK